MCLSFICDFWLLNIILNSTELKCTQNIKLYHFVRIPFCPYHFVQYHFVRIPFCPYHFVRYHFVRSPLKWFRRPAASDKKTYSKSNRKMLTTPIFQASA